MSKYGNKNPTQPSFYIFENIASELEHSMEKQNFLKNKKTSFQKESSELSNYHGSITGGISDSGLKNCHVQNRPGLPSLLYATLLATFEYNVIQYSHQWLLGNI